MMEHVTTLSNLSFWLFAGMMIVGALGVVFHRSIVYGAMSLLLAFLSIAAVFGLLNAPFLAAAQVLVYGVGLTIVMIFGIMLTGDKPFRDLVGQERPNRYWQLPLAAITVLSGLLVWTILQPNMLLTKMSGLFTVQENLSPEALLNLPGAQAVIQDGGLLHIAGLLFTRYLLPFELASILLLLAMVGAILLSKRQLPEEQGQAELADLSKPACSVSDSTDYAQVVSKLESAMAASEDKQTMGVH